MKVLKIHNFYRFLGGEDIMFKVISRMLRNKGITVSLFERDSRNLKGVWAKIRTFINCIYYRSCINEFSIILENERPDLVHIHNLYPLISPSVLLDCRKYNVPVVMHCHNYRLICPTGLHLRKGVVCELCNGGKEYWCVLTNCRDNIFESLVYALRNAVNRKSGIFRENVSYYIAPTEFVRHRLIRSGLAAERIIVVPNTAPIAAEKVDCSRGEYIAYAGQIIPAKGIETLLEAARITGLPVYIAGDSKPMETDIKNAPQNVVFLGQLGRDNINRFYRDARFLVVPSIWFEVFPLVIIEAMGHGLPILASRIGELPKIVEDGITGFLFEPGNSEELAYKMKRLWDNPILCGKMGQAGREKAIREYSEDVFFKRLMEVYEKAIKSMNR